MLVRFIQNNSNVNVTSYLFIYCIRVLYLMIYYDVWILTSRGTGVLLVLAVSSNVVCSRAKFLLLKDSRRSISYTKFLTLKNSQRFFASHSKLFEFLQLKNSQMVFSRTECDKYCKQWNRYTEQYHTKKKRIRAIVNSSEGIYITGFGGIRDLFARN